MIPEAILGTPEIDPSEIVIQHALGDGAYGTVYKGMCRSNAVAVKRLHKQDLSDSEIENFRREVEILSYVLVLNSCDKS